MRTASAEQYPTDAAWAARRRRVRSPGYLQMEATECGAAALGAVLAYHGRFVSLEELRVQCGVSRDGTKASNIVRAAKYYGLAASGYRVEPDRLAAIPLPAIVHWNFNHFVVLDGFDRRWVYINDPAVGPQRVTHDEYSRGFTGVVITLQPTDRFRRAGRPPRLLPLLWPALAGSKAAVAFVVLASLLLALPGIAVPVFAKVFVDEVLVGRFDGWLKPLMAGLAVTVAVQAAILWLQQHQLVRLETKLGLVLSSRFLRHVLRLPMPFFMQRHAGDLAGRISGIDRIARLLSGELAGTMLGIATAAIFAVAMMLLNPALAAVAIPLAMVNLLALRIVGRRREETARRLSKDEAQLAANTLGSIRVIETLKASGLEQDAFARWAGFHAGVLTARTQLERQTAKLRVVPPLLASLGNAGVLGLGSLLVMRGAMSVGELVAFQALAARFAGPIGQLVAFGSRLPEIKADLVRIADVMAHPVDPRATGGAPMAASQIAPQGMVELRDVVFGYNPNEPALIDGFSLTVKPGMRVALVGASGSGKSTIARLISGLYRPWTGEIRIDGRRIDEIPSPALAGMLASVEQDSTLFAGSLRDNVSMWSDEVNESTVTRALRDAAIHDEIAARPGRYEQELAEGGANLSGGQRQRLEIARALALDPAILVLDEAMAGLDPLVEAEIDDHLRRRGCTCILIAHRLSTIRDCDEIVMLDEGKVVGRGTHMQLMASCPGYARLLQCG